MNVTNTRQCRLFLLAAVGILLPLMVLNKAKRAFPSSRAGNNVKHGVFSEESDKMTPKLKVLSNHIEIPSPKWIRKQYPKLSTDFCNRTSPPEIPILQLRNDQFRVYHIGKAAGGTVQARLQDGYRVNYTQCHPNPTPCYDEEDIGISYDNQYRFLNVRDPIDRYVGAFEWTLTIQCQPGETPGPCHKISKRVMRVYAKYNEDPSLLGEALCDPDNGFKLNQTVIDEDLANMKHMKVDNVIHHWLGEHRKELYDWKQLADHLYPLVVERPYDLIRMVDEAIYHMARATMDQKDSSSRAESSSLVGDLNVLPLRQYYASCHLTKEDSNMHSSSAVRGTPKLSERAQLCLARYYQRDYELLPDLKRLACKSDDCRGALQSIIDRRAPLLAKLPPRTR